MTKTTLYHGSQVESFTPTYGFGSDTHDYGRGFYTTADKELGKEWAVGQQANADGWLHAYEVDVSILGELLSLGDLGIQYFFRSQRAFAALKELPELKERVPISEYKARFDARDDQARRKMVELVYDLKRNPLEHVFSELLREPDNGTSI